MHCYKKRPNWPVIILMAVLCGSNLGLYINSQEQNRAIVDQQELIYELELTADKANYDLRDANEHLRAYEIIISQLEEELAYYQ